MSQPARKSGDTTTSKLGDALPPDDPSIPVLTERLTLPPLDLDLDFNLPPRPADQPAQENEAPADVPIQPFEPLPPRGGRIEPLGIESFEALENDEQDTRTATPPEETEAVEEGEGDTVAGDTVAGDTVTGEDASPTTLLGPATEIEPPEPAEDAPRVPTSLLISNVDALLPNPPDPAAYREADEFDLTQEDGSGVRMESNLREMILLELARRLPMEVETIVRRHLEGAIDEAIRRFAAEVRIALAGSLREMVDRAVKAELDRLKIPRG